MPGRGRKAPERRTSVSPRDLIRRSRIALANPEKAAALRKRANGLAAMAAKPLFMEIELNAMHNRLHMSPRFLAWRRTFLRSESLQKSRSRFCEIRGGLPDEVAREPSLIPTGGRGLVSVGFVRSQTHDDKGTTASHRRASSSEV